MSRKPDPTRKPELLAQILDYLLDKPLASLTFRSAASALGVSTYTLVYQFGTRAELVSEILRAVTIRQAFVEEIIAAAANTLDAYYESLRVSWNWALVPENRQLQRLEFEAAMLEAVEPGSHNYSRDLYREWLRVGREALESFGVDTDSAEVEARIMMDAFYGLQYDLVVNGDEEGATRVFNQIIERHRKRVESLAEGRVLS